LGPSDPKQPAPPPAGPRLVRCALLHKELPGLPAAPFPNELGRRIYESISQEAWSLWVRHSQMVINEKGLKLANPGDREALMRECEAFLFGGRSEPPPGWVPLPGSVRITKK
jgi:Fe-S cluster biosynthesis and repair protein YggX